MEARGDEEVADGSHVQTLDVYPCPPESTDEQPNGICV